ncbi:MAG: type II toxin-antitoxin system HigB family toxin [Acidobacteria bacterium]|nr:type II toxin-antitoxin system HigB family toxin [Acidobacteriota bacterium]
MLIANYEAIEKFAKKRAQARSRLNTWRDVTLKTLWRNFDDVKKTFPATDIYGNCVIFDVGGNNYRLIATINYEAEQVSIKAVMTHAEYDREKWKRNC